MLKSLLRGQSLSTAEAVDLGDKKNMQLPANAKLCLSTAEAVDLGD